MLRARGPCPLHAQQLRGTPCAQLQAHPCTTSCYAAACPRPCPRTIWKGMAAPLTGTLSTLPCRAALMVQPLRWQGRAQRVL